MKKALICSVLALSGCVNQKGFIDSATLSKEPIVITSIFTLYPNSAGGAGVVIDFVNTSGKAIKYVSFNMTPFNSVGDEVASEIDGLKEKQVRLVGPIENGFDTKGMFNSMLSSPGRFNNVWYNQTIVCSKINSIKIEFMSGDAVSISGVNLSKVMAPGVKNNCGVI
ncbi:hypothetical protein FXI35_004889 [Escherichia coli]|nr:hypothetical protein [Escherichia coli]